MISFVLSKPDTAGWAWLELGTQPASSTGISSPGAYDPPHTCSHRQRVETVLPSSSPEGGVGCPALPSSPVNALLMVITEPQSLQLTLCMVALAAAFLGHYCWHRPTSLSTAAGRRRGEGLLDQTCHCIALAAEFFLGTANCKLRLPKGFSTRASDSLLVTPACVKLPLAACNVIPCGREAVCLPLPPCLWGKGSWQWALCGVLPSCSPPGNM